MKESVEYINGLHDSLEEQYPFMQHSEYWWGYKTVEEANEVAVATVKPEEATLEQWQHMRAEFGDLLSAVLIYGHKIGIAPTDVFDLAIASFNETRRRAETGFYPRRDRLDSDVRVSQESLTIHESLE